MKKTIFILLLFFGTTALYAQAPSCSCPPMKMYVYDTKLSFPIDTTDGAAEAGKYLEAQNSGDWLEGDYTKQQSADFKVYKGLMPGAKTGTGYQQPPSDGSGPGGDIDFTSFAGVFREGTPGKYTYDVTLHISDAHRSETIINITQIATDLGDVDNMIDALVSSLGSVPDKLRDYQKKLRDQSGEAKWIGAKWKATADKSNLKIDETTNVHIKVFDCADEKAIPNQSIKLSLTDDHVGSLDKATVKTDASGEATVVFRAKDNGETRIIPDFTFTDIYDKTGHGTSCGDKESIDVANSLYQITAEFEASGPAGISYHFTGKCKAYLKPLPDGTYMLAPMDKSRDMDLTIDRAFMTEYSTFVGPKEYKIPFLFTIDKMGKQPGAVHATFGINTICPSKGQVTWIFNGGGHSVTYICDVDKGSLTYIPGNTTVLPGLAGHPLGMNGVTNLDILQYFGLPQMKKDVSENLSNGQDFRAFAQRMQAHQNDPNYFKTAQGRADLEKMQTLQKQMGHNGPTPKNMGEAEMLKDSYKFAPPDPSQTPKMLPGMARIRVEDTFNRGSSTAFDGTLNGGIGPIQASIKVKVERLN